MLELVILIISLVLFVVTFFRTKTVSLYRWQGIISFIASFTSCFILIFSFFHWAGVVFAVGFFVWGLIAIIFPKSLCEIIPKDTYS